MVKVIRWSTFLIGLVFFSAGITLAINVQNLGVQAWDTLHVALNDKFGLTIGTWSILIGFILIGTTLILDNSYIMICTFLNLVYVGLLVDFHLWLDVLYNALVI